MVRRSDDKTFKISKATALQIAEGLGFTLTKEDLTELEGAVRHTIRLRRLIVLMTPDSDELAKADALKLFFDQCQRIARHSDRLLTELKRNPALPTHYSFKGNLRTHQITTLLRSKTSFDDFVAELRIVRDFAASQRPFRDERRASRKGRKPQADVEGWDPILEVLTRLFYRRGKTPTANYLPRTPKRLPRYTSALLRGFLRLHDILPADVRAKSPDSEFFLGSYAHTWIRTENKKKRDPAYFLERLQFNPSRETHEDRVAALEALTHED